MNFYSELQSSAQTGASNPKVFAAVSGATAALGGATITDLITSALSYGAMLSGIIATILLGRVHWASYKNHMLQTKILKKQLRDLNIDPDSEE